MNLSFIETFLSVARLGSFRAAADRLNLTQAAVSNRIAALEIELGHSLFDRSPGSVRLSQVGQRAIEPAERLMRAAASFQAAIADPVTLKARVTIGTIDTIVHSWLPQFIERVKERYPGLALDLNVDTSLNIGREVAEGRIDLALVIGPVLSPGLRNLDLGEFACDWVASPRCGLGGHHLGLADLAGLPIFAFSRNSQPHEWLVRQFSEAGFRRVQISNSNSLATIMRLIRDGMGIAPLPRAILKDALASGELELLNVAPAFTSIRLHATYTDRPDNLIPGVLAEIAREVSLGEAAQGAEVIEKTGCQ